MTLGFYFNMQNCIGCRTCQIACKDKNDLPVGIIYRHVHSYETGSFPNVGIFNFSASCNHCENPACVAICPVGAMQKAEDGTVVHDDELCIGCQSCVNACPYGVPQYREELNITGKCDACASLRAQGKKPACVASCLMRCLDFGDVDELVATYGPDYVHDLGILPSSDQTGPNTLIVAKSEALDASYVELLM